MHSIIDSVIQTNNIENDLFKQTLSQKQKEITYEYLEKNHKDLVFTFKVFQR